MLLRPRLRSAAAAALFLGVVACGLAASTSSSAHTSGGSQLPEDVPSVTDEGARAKVMLVELAAAVVTAPAAEPGATPGPAPTAKPGPSDAVRSIRTARQALARAHGAHLAGDADGARRLGRVALGWAEAARAQLAAAAAERAGMAIERQAAELARSRDRARAMLVEAQARKGQLGAQIAQKKAAIDAARAPRTDRAGKGGPTSNAAPPKARPGAPSTPAPRSTAPSRVAPPQGGTR